MKTLREQMRELQPGLKWSWCSEPTSVFGEYKPCVLVLVEEARCGLPLNVLTSLGDRKARSPAHAAEIIRKELARLAQVFGEAAKAAGRLLDGELHDELPGRGKKL